jgi:hypothetical protein
MEKNIFTLKIPKIQQQQKSLQFSSRKFDNIRRKINDF